MIAVEPGRYSAPARSMYSDSAGQKRLKFGRDGFSAPQETMGWDWPPVMFLWVPQRFSAENAADILRLRPSTYPVPERVPLSADRAIEIAIMFVSWEFETTPQ